MRRRNTEERECTSNSDSNGNRDGPADVEKKQDKAKKKEGEAEKKDKRKGSKYDRDIGLLETERVHVTEAEGLRSLTQTAHVSSDPLEGDNPNKQL